MKKTLLMLALAAGITSFAQNAQAALISINIGPSGFNIGGINGGAPGEGYNFASNFPIGGNFLVLFNNYMSSYSGLEGGGLAFAAGASAATPVKFSLNALIDSSSSYPRSSRELFKNGSTLSPDFGAGSYMGFRTSQGNYGWLEVTWNRTSEEFQIYSGAYESEAGVGILAGAGPSAAVPEPGTWAAAALLVGGAGFMRWRKRAKVA